MKDLTDYIQEEVGKGTSEEKEAWFEERTNMHIDLVQKAAKKIVDEYPELEALLGEVKDHDASKLVEPERTPYIELTWKHKFDDHKGYKTPGDIDDKAINKATMHHILNNSHHPEFHLEDKDDANLDPENRDKSLEVIDVPNMDDISIAHMVADWQAMSEELQKNTAREWYDKQKGVRWNFTPEQDKLIDKLLKVFETREPYHSMDLHDGADEDDGW